MNEAIGGVATAMHCKGQAIDLDDVYGYKTNAEMFQYVKDKFLKPTPKEITINPRSRSAILRVAEKLC